MKVMVVGGANIDIKCRLDADLVMAASNPGSVSLSVGGVGRNIAHNLAQLDADVHLVTALGDDLHAEMIRRACDAAQFRLSAHVSSRPTGTYTAILDQTGDLVVGVAAMDCINALTAAATEPFLALMPRPDWLVADANLDEDTLMFLAGQARMMGAAFAFEPVSVAKCRVILPSLQRFGLDFMSPNRAQLAALAHDAADRDMNDLAPACAVLHRQGVRNIIVGLGPQGAFWSDGRANGYVPALARAVVDATGGGDAAFAGALWALQHGESLDAAAVIGQRAAALAVSVPQTVNALLTARYLKEEIHD